MSMAERYPGDGAMANGFGRRHLHEDEARLLYEADYPAPPDMRVPGSWRLSVGGVPVPLASIGADRRAKIVRIRSSLLEQAQNQSRYAPDSNALWTAYFDRRHEEQLSSTNSVEPRDRLNSDGRRQWWGIPGRTLDAVLEYIEAGNTPRLEYPEPPPSLVAAAAPGRRGEWRRRHPRRRAASPPDRRRSAPSSRSHRRRRSGAAPAVAPSPSTRVAVAPLLPPPGSLGQRPSRGFSP